MLRFCQRLLFRMRNLLSHATPLVMPKAKAQKLFLYTLAFKKLCHSHALWMLHIQAKKIFIACENNIHIRHNIRILPSLSMTQLMAK